jgi:hypothetical protein
MSRMSAQLYSALSLELFLVASGFIVIVMLSLTK